MKSIVNARYQRWNRMILGSLIVVEIETGQRHDSWRQCFKLYGPWSFVQVQIDNLIWYSKDFCVVSCEHIFIVISAVCFLRRISFDLHIFYLFWKKKREAACIFSLQHIFVFTALTHVSFIVLLPHLSLNITCASVCLIDTWNSATSCASLLMLPTLNIYEHVQTRL